MRGGGCDVSGNRVGSGRLLVPAKPLQVGADVAMGLSVAWRQPDSLPMLLERLLETTHLHQRRPDVVAAQRLVGLDSHPFLKMRPGLLDPAAPRAMKLDHREVVVRQPAL